MKFLALIMALLVFTQSFMPCGDKDGLDYACKAKTTLLEASGHQPEQPHDNCSPFCTCSCCASVAFLEWSLNTSVFVPRVAPAYGTIFTASLFTVALPVWQPPRLI